MPGPYDEPTLREQFTRPRPRRFVWFGLLLLPCVAAFVAVAALASSYFHLDFDATAAFEIGALILVLTLIRPWWFWNHPYAVFVRSAIGDAATVGLYIVIGAAAVWGGVQRQRAITSGRRECLRALAATPSQHDRMKILYGAGVHDLPAPDGGPRSIDCERLLEHR